MSAAGELLVPDEAAGQRLDAWLADQLDGASRSRVRAWIDAGRVLVDGRAQKASSKLMGGERVLVDEPAPTATELVPQELPLAVLFRDEHIIVVDKPAGLVVHPGAGNPDGTLANAVRFLAPEATVGGELRPGIVHRLDKDTSGVIVCALTDDAHHALSAAFKARAVDKRYTAFCIGKPKQAAFDLVTGHKRHPRDRRRFTTCVPAPDGELDGGVRRAHSSFVVLAASGGLCELDVTLHTGRTHQIRAHLADTHHPIAGDELYGGGNAAARVAHGPVRDAVRALARQALHARLLAFDHPASGERVSFEAPLPDDLARLRAAIAEAAG